MPVIVNDDGKQNRYTHFLNKNREGSELLYPSSPWLILLALAELSNEKTRDTCKRKKNIKWFKVLQLALLQLQLHNFFYTFARDVLVMFHWSRDQSETHPVTLWPGLRARVTWTIPWKPLHPGNYSATLNNAAFRRASLTYPNDCSAVQVMHSPLMTTQVRYDSILLFVFAFYLRRFF